MKKSHIPIIIIFSIASFCIGHSFRCDAGKKKIIKRATDERGLTSVVYKEGKDTFAFDDLSKSEYDSIFNR